jgi:hypothetical protein
MRRIKIVTGLIALFVVLGLPLALAYAQEPTREPREEGAGGEIGGLGLADPPPLPGFSVLYMFTGVANDNKVATSVLCTNFGSTATTIGIQFFLPGGGITGFSPYTDTLVASETGTYSTQPTFFGGEVPLSTGVIAQGSGRVLFKGHSQIICTAQLLQPGNDITPTFMVRLPLFDSAGNRVGGLSRVFLPLILKQS